MEADRAVVRDVFGAGAGGYVLKEAAGEELVRTIRKAATGA
jgi:DNA-binding NarL/FixJ family response regulator